MTTIQSGNYPLMACAFFYALLCVFSIVTGIIYMIGKREPNPLELSDDLVKKLTETGKFKEFQRRMGFVTAVVGVVQGITSYSILKGESPVFYWIALGFTIFSIGSVLFKLKSKINAFPLLKLIAYTAILVILLLKSTRMLFF